VTAEANGATGEQKKDGEDQGEPEACVPMFKPKEKSVEY